MAAVDFAPEVEQAQAKIRNAYPHMTPRQVSYLAGYLDAMASRKEEETKEEKPEEQTA